MTVYVFAADGFEETELVVPADILRRGGLNVRIAAVTNRDGAEGKTVTGGHGMTLTADCMCQEVTLEDGDCVVLPGGTTGVANLFESQALKAILQAAAERGLLIGAICAAPTILQRRGYLAGRRFTCYPGLADAGLPGTFCGEPVVCDGNLITAEGAGASFGFGKALLAALRGTAAAEQVLSEMRYR